MTLSWLPVLVAFFVALLTLVLLLRGTVLRSVVDHPNARSLHAIPIPRTGGLGLMAGVLAGWGLMWQPWLIPLAGGVMFLMMLSFLDDVRGLSAGLRFLMHFAVAGAFVWLTISPDSGWMLAIVLIVAMVWMTNLYNFMDGSDGLAGGMALIGFGSYALAAWLSGDQQLACGNLVVVAAALAFLRFNFHPAKIFMGDAGSIPLGFLSAALGVLGWQRGIWPLWFPVLVFSPFVVDASVTLMRRLLRGEKIWQAHREHFYQQLVQMGWGHRRTALVEYAMMAAVGASALWLLPQPISLQMAFGLGWLLAYLLAMKIIHDRWRMFERNQHEKP